jgi:hypothetical protein
VGDKFTGGLCINTASSINQDTLVSTSTFTNVGQSCAEGRIEVIGTDSGANDGVVISHNLIGNANSVDTGAADGVNLAGGSVGTQIIGNEFENIQESACGSVHCDAIQFYGATQTLISGNYFYNNSTGIMSADGNGSPFTVSNNVFNDTGGYPWPIYDSGGHSDVITHNTVEGNGNAVSLGGSNQGNASGETVTNNIIGGGIANNGGGNTIDYNLIPGGGGGTHGSSGTPTFTGGSSPSTWSGFALSCPGSSGCGAASDGKNMGADVSVAPGP